MLRPAFLGFLGLFSWVPTAYCDDVVPWDTGEIAGWNIAVDATAGFGCFIYAAFDGNAIVRLGIDNFAEQIYLLVGDMDWNSIENEQAYDIELQFGRKRPWKAEAMGGRMGDTPTLEVSTDEPEFLTEFSKEKGITVTYKKKVIASLSLKGTSAAVNEMLLCQKTINDAIPIEERSLPGEDPFLTEVNAIG